MNNYAVELTLAGVALLCCLMILTAFLVRFVSQAVWRPTGTRVKLYGGPQDGLEIMVSEGCKRICCPSGESPGEEYWAVYVRVVGDGFTYGGTEIRQKGDRTAKPSR